jgi:hypothetical protein
MGRDITTKEEVTAHEPPHRFDVKSRDLPVSYEIHHTLELEDDARTRLRVDVDVKIGTMMRIAAQPALKAAERELRNDFERLKELLEADGASERGT